MPNTIGSLLKHATPALAGGCEHPRLDAECLLAHSLGVTRSHLYARADEQVAKTAASKYRQLIERRARGEPLAYLTGRKEFWSLDLRVSPATLIPRPETEGLVALALARAEPGAHIVDLGTGSGAIAIALGTERPEAVILATDASAAALAIARANASNHGLANLRFKRVQDARDWYAPCRGQLFDLIVSNPPYVPDTDPGLNGGQLRFEPRAALAAGVDGLDDIRKIVAGAPAHLAPGGWLLIEHGMEQGPAVRDLFDQAGFAAIETCRDLAGLERVTLGRSTATEARDQ